MANANANVSKMVLHERAKLVRDVVDALLAGATLSAVQIYPLAMWPAGTVMPVRLVRERTNPLAPRNFDGSLDVDALEPGRDADSPVGYQAGPNFVCLPLGGGFFFPHAIL